MRTIVFLVLAVAIVGGPHTAVRADDGLRDPMRAFVLSFAVPGLGEYYAGESGSAVAYVAAELALWGGYYYTGVMREAYRNDAFMYAAQHAGVNPSDRGSSYINDMAVFNSSFDYNNYQLQVSGHPLLYDGANTWEWDAESHRRHFRSLRERELNFKNYAKYCIAGVVLNHFLSGLHASNLVRTDSSGAAVTVTPLSDGIAVYRAWSY